MQRQFTSWPRHGSHHCPLLPPSTPGQPALPAAGTHPAERQDLSLGLWHDKLQWFVFPWSFHNTCHPRVSDRVLVSWETQGLSSQSILKKSECLCIPKSSEIPTVTDSQRIINQVKISSSVQRQFVSGFEI